MNPNRTTKPRPRDFLCVHQIEHLPDSSELRRKLLEGVIDALPREHRIRAVAFLMLKHLNDFDREQRQLALDFQEPPTTKVQ
jgi:hypothetical protein